MHGCPNGLQATQRLFDTFFENVKANDCFHLHNMTQDTKYVTFIALLLDNDCNSSAYGMTQNVTNTASDTEVSKHQVNL